MLKRTGPLVALGLLSLIWGYNWVVMKIGLKDCPPLLFASLRVLGGAMILLPLLRLFGRPLALPPLSYVVPLGLLQSTGFVGCTLWALESGAAGKTAILVYMMPLWLLMMAWPVLGERIRGWQWPAMGFAFLGLFLILDPGRTDSSLHGTLLAILSGIFWAISAVWQKKMAPPGIDLLTVTAWQMVFGGLGLLFLAILRDPLTLHWSPALIGALLYNALPGNALAWLLWAYALRHLPSGVAGMGTLVAPLVGVLASWAQLGEHPGSREFQGMLFIFLALFLVTWQHLRMQNDTALASGPEESGE